MSNSDVDILLADAQTALRNKEFETARDLIAAVQSLDPDNADAARLLRFIDVASARRPAGARVTSALKSAKASTESKRRTSPMGVPTTADAGKAEEDPRVGRMREAYQASDYPQALALAEELLHESPDNELASRFKRFCELALRSQENESPEDLRKTRQLAAFRVLKKKPRRTKK